MTAAAVLDLSGKRVVVTGGSRGIGAACCRLFARAGAAVGIVYRASDERAGALLAELREIAPAAPHWLHRTDQSRPDQVERLFAFVGREWGRLDCLVNNAGVWERNPLGAFDLDGYRRAMDTNVLGPFACTAAALPLLRAAEDGNVVNLSSTAGQRGEAFYSPYAATKGAMISATKAWAVELAPARAGQRGRPRLGGDRHERRRPWRAPGGSGSTPPSRSAGWRRPRRSPARSSSSPRRSPATSPARSSTSTAARCSRGSDGLLVG